MDDLCLVNSRYNFTYHFGATGKSLSDMKSLEFMNAEIDVAIKKLGAFAILASEEIAEDKLLPMKCIKQ